MKDKYLALLYYYLGDITWEIFLFIDGCFLRSCFRYLFLWDWYQTFMKKSLDYDEKAGNIIWKSSEHENEL
jgi:hypothetical protein